jgi:hypothetical protein
MNNNNSYNTAYQVKALLEKSNIHEDSDSKFRLQYYSLSKISIFSLSNRNLRVAIEY